MSGKRFPEEFKIEAVKQVVDRSYSVSSVTLAQIQCSAKSEIFVFLTLAQIQCSAKSEIFVFPETSDEFSRSHVI